MQFLLIIAHDDKFRASEDLISNVYRWIEQNSERGVRVRGAPLKPSADAITIRVRDGVLSRKSGPFGSAQDQMAAFELIECGDLEEAVEIASSHPMAAAATIEIRPVWPELAKT
jgi:hypothetical protein